MSRSHHLVDPELLPLLDVVPDRRMSREALPEYRRIDAEARGRAAPVEGVHSFELEVPHDPGVRVLAYCPTDVTRPLPGILHIHGGGFVLGSPEAAAANNAELARTLNAAVFSVAYRLAPEAPYPAAIEDCFAALSGIVARAEKLRIDPTRIALLGESAGGGLAAALSLLARDRGGPAIDFQMLIFPMLDDREKASAEPHAYAGEFVWTLENNRFGWNAIKGPLAGEHEIPHYLAPARAADLSELPPTYIHVGALDLFIEENLEYARRLIRAGVPTELHVFSGAFHAFQLCDTAEVSRRAHETRLAALRRWIDRPARGR